MSARSYLDSLIRGHTSHVEGLEAEHLESCGAEARRKGSCVNVQDEIKHIIESCTTARGGYNARFFRVFGIPVGKGFQIPGGWKRRLMVEGDLDDIKAKAAAYHGKLL